MTHTVREKAKLLARVRRMKVRQQDVADGSGKMPVSLSGEAADSTNP